MSSGKILITGGSGFIGTNLVESYLGQGWDVLNLDVKGPMNTNHDKLYKKCDVNDRDLVLKLFKDFRPELVVHLAARVDLDGKDVDADYFTNGTGAKNVIDAVNQTGSVQRASYASSRMVFKTGNLPKHEWDYSPALVYGASKVRTEEVVRAQPADSVPWVIFRPTSIWGEWFEVPYRDFFMTVSKNRYMHPKGQRIMKSYGYVGNTIRQIQRYMEAPEAMVARHAFFVCDHPPLEVMEWATTISKEMGRQPIREIPYSVLKSIAIVGDGLKKLGMSQPPLTSFRLNNLTIQLEYDLSRELAVWEPIKYTMPEGVKRTVAWMKQAHLI